MYTRETWAIRKSDELKLLIFERKMLRNIYGTTLNSESGRYERIKIKKSKICSIHQTYKTI